MKIGKRVISKKNIPLIIPEMGINHFGSLKLAKKIVIEAKKSGAEAIKVQIHIPDEEMSLEAIKVKPGNSKKNIYQIIKENSLSLNEEYELKGFIEKNSLIYIATPFSFAAADWLIENNVKVIKIGSGECNNLPLIEHISKHKIPMIISTGMNSISSVKETYQIVKKNNTPHAFLHCVNLYPTSFRDSRLKRINKLKNQFKNSIIGYSDHTIGNTAPIVALSMGALIIEKHFVISRNRKGPDTICSMDRFELKELIKKSKEIFDLFSNNSEILKKEDVTRKFAFHSLVSRKEIKKGEKINKNNLTTKRPGTGDFPAKKYKKLIGKIAKMDIPQNTLIYKNQIK
jgi:N-acetylneuraminate synthase